jgi:Mg2+-importing ATPase
MKNIIDKAVIAYSKKNNIDSIINMYEKTDEIPFDYSRRKMSIMVK